jgi:hypothetical protein
LVVYVESPFDAQRDIERSLPIPMQTERLFFLSLYFP